MFEVQIKHVIEGALFGSTKPLNLAAIAAIFPEYEQPSEAELKIALSELLEDYAERGVQLVKVASGYRFQVRQELSEWIERLFEEKPPRYSRALIETLVLIAYRQPITRAEIEDVRGVSVSTSMVKTLMEREWIRIVGYRDVPGRPALYATTKEFLDYFNLKSLAELPPMATLSESAGSEQENNIHNQDVIDEDAQCLLAVPEAVETEEAEPV